MNFLSRYSASHALVIGIDKYAHCPPLANACNDALAIVSALTESSGFDSKSVRTLLDKEATRENILATLIGFRKLCQRDDRLVVFFAGHGHSETGNRKTHGFLVPVDGNPTDLETLIRWQSLVEDAELIPAKHILFVMDACFSGLLMQRAGPSSGSRFVSDMLQRYSRQAITAGKADQLVADGGKGKNSLFTEYFVEALRGSAADKNGVITASSAMHYAYTRVSKDPKSDQTPHYGHLEGDGDMVLSFPKLAQIDTHSSGDHLSERVAEIPEPSQPEPATALASVKDPAFSDPEAPTFGTNPRTTRLARRYWSGGSLVTDRAQSFLAIQVIPSAPIDYGTGLAKLAGRVQEHARQNTPKAPYWGLIVPSDLRSTLKSVILSEAASDNSNLWHRYIQILSNGRIEFSDADNAVRYHAVDENNVPSGTYWRFVGTIGLLLSSLELARTVYSEIGYRGGYTVSVNLVNTRQTRLVDYAKGDGLDKKHWRNPFDFESRMLGGFPGGKECEDQNIQLEYQLTQSAAESALAELVEDAARQISLAFDKREEHLLCFNYGTKVFPWNQFASEWAR